MTSAVVESVAALHDRFVLTPWVAQAGRNVPTIVRGEGSWLIDDEGKRYLDFSAGLVAVNLGHAHPRLVQAIADQAARLCYASPALRNDKRAQLAREIIALAPWQQGGRIFFTTGGGEANEDAVKIARTITGRHKVLSAYRSFHGSAPGAGTLTGENRRWPNEPGIPGIVHFFTPFPYRSPFFTRDAREETARALSHLEEVLVYENAERVAAILIEPVVGSNGVILYPDGYLAGLREICDRHGILLIFDEVMTGFGRTGAAFASQRFGVVPDMFTFAKGVTSAYVPLGGVAVRDDLAQYFDSRPLPNGHTFSGHPLAMAAGVAALEAYRDERLFDRAREVESWLHEDLTNLQERHAAIGEVRGTGAFFAIELVSNRDHRTPLVPWQGSQSLHNVLAPALQRGLYLFARYNVLIVSPPLTITRTEVSEAANVLNDVLASVSSLDSVSS